MRWSGTKHTIEALVEGHYQSLYRFAYRLCGQTQEAEDLVQEAFCQAQAKWQQLRDATRARPWLFTILRNAYLHKVRDRKMAGVIAVDDLDGIPERALEPLPSIEPQQLQQALNELPEVFRTPIILYYFEDFSYRDISDQMAIPLGTVMSRLARAKAFLKTRLFAVVEAGVLGKEGE
jgi:RNA polymerase sigma-70 factor (ECF subfamily)